MNIYLILGRRVRIYNFTIVQQVAILWSPVYTYVNSLLVYFMSILIFSDIRKKAKDHHFANVPDPTEVKNVGYVVHKFP